MNSLTLGFKDFLDNFAKVSILSIQILISVFCLMLVTSQFKDSLISLQAYKQVENRTIVKFAESTLSNIVREDDRNQSNIINILTRENTFSWFSDSSSNSTTTYILYGDPKTISGMGSNDFQSLIYTSKNTNKKTIANAIAKYNLKEPQIVNREWIFDSNSGALNLDNKLAVFDLNLQNQIMMDQENLQTLISNLHLFDFSENAVSQVAFELSDNNTKYYPYNIRTIDTFEMRKLSDNMLVTFFSIVFIFVIINIVTSIKNIVKQKNTEFYIHRLYGLNKISGMIRLSCLIFFASFLPSVASVIICAKFTSYSSSLLIWIMFFIVFNGSLLLAIKESVLKDDISSNLRSTYE